MPYLPATNVAIIKEWRELGFFYEFDENVPGWRIVGSKSGLRKFAKLLAEYSEEPGNQSLSEHSHYGPYKYLKIMTWSEPRIDSDAIAGSVSDLKRLHGLVAEAISKGSTGDVIVVDKEYADSNEVKLILEIKSHTFDPASGDDDLSMPGAPQLFAPSQKRQLEMLDASERMKREMLELAKLVLQGDADLIKAVNDLASLGRLFQMLCSDNVQAAFSSCLIPSTNLIP